MCSPIEIFQLTCTHMLTHRQSTHEKKEMTNGLYKQILYFCCFQIGPVQQLFSSAVCKRSCFSVFFCCLQSGLVCVDFQYCGQLKFFAAWYTVLFLFLQPKLNLYNLALISEALPIPPSPSFLYLVIWRLANQFITSVL